MGELVIHTTLPDGLLSLLADMASDYLGLCEDERFRGVCGVPLGPFPPETHGNEIFDSAGIYAYENPLIWVQTTVVNKGERIPSLFARQ